MSQELKSGDIQALSKAARDLEKTFRELNRTFKSMAHSLAQVVEKPQQKGKQMEILYPKPEKKKGNKNPDRRWRLEYRTAYSEIEKLYYNFRFIARFTAAMDYNCSGWLFANLYDQRQERIDNELQNLSKE